MDNKTRLLRTNIDNDNSIFSLEAKYVTDIWDTEGNELKFNFNVNENRLTIFGDVDAIYVLFKN